MKKIFAWASALVAVMLLTGAIPMIGIVKAAIPVPHNLWGHPYDETSVQMPVGELITSWIDGVEYGRNDTFMAAAEVWFDVDTAGNWVTAPLDPNTPWVKEGGDLNESIMYAWGDMTNIKTDPDGDTVLNSGVFVESELWNTTVVTLLDINLAIVQPTHFPKISQIIPEPNDIWPDYVFMYTEDPAFLMDGYYLQKNDGVLSGPVQTLTGISNTFGYFYANLTAIDLNTCGDELKLVWTNTGSAFGGMDIVVDRVEWNATVGGCHFTEPDNTIATDATAPAADFAIHRTGIVLADDTNDNAADFVTDVRWPRPLIGAPVLAWDVPAGGEDWTGGMNHTIQITAYDDNALNSQILFWVNYSTQNGNPGTWFEATLGGVASHPFNGSGDAVTPMVFDWAVPCDVPFTDIAVLNVEAENPNRKAAKDVWSNQFTIDCEAPYVLSTDPVNLDTLIDVPIDQVITVTFHEDMGPTNATVVPDPGITVTNPTPDTLQIDHTDFLENTTYCVYVFGTDDSITGNAMAAVESYCFTTYIVTVPVITVTVPMGGEDWTGGSLHDIEFTMTHAGAGSVWFWINYSCPVSSGPIVGAPDLLSPIIWTVPVITENDCIVSAVVQDTDDNAVAFDDSELFEIDSTPPTVLSNDPLPLQIDVAVDTTVVVAFDEPMDKPSVESGWTMEDSGGAGVIGSFSWDATNETVTFAPGSLLAGGMDYTVTIASTAKDDSLPGGNAMGAAHVFSFTTMIVDEPPTVTVTIPTASTLWAGGAIELITWDMDDNNGAENLTVDVSYIHNSVSYVIATGLSGAINYSWTVACPAGAEATGVTIFVVATDASSLAANDTSDPFDIDCTDPAGTIAHSGEEMEGETISFRIEGGSTDIASYAWNFGDGTTGIGATPTHIYEDDGSYQVTCTLTDSAGNSASATPETLTIEKEEITEKSFLEEYWWIILIIIIVVIVVMIALAKRKKPEEEEEEAPAEEEEEEEAPAEEEEEEYEEEEPEEEYEEEEVVEEEPEVEEEAAPAEPEPAPEAPEPAPEEAPAAAAAPAAEEAAPAEEAPAGETKECPSCGTVVPGDASECFLCGATL